MAFLTKTDFFNLAEGGLLKVKAYNKPANLGGTAVGFDDNGLAAVWDSFRLSHSISAEYGIIGDGDFTIKLGGVHTVDGVTYMLTGVNASWSNSAAPTFNATGIQVEDGAGDADNAIDVVFHLTKNHKPTIWADIATRAAVPTHNRIWLQSAGYNLTCDSWADAITDAEQPLAAGIVASGIRNIRMECALTFLGDGTAAGSDVDFSGGDYTIGANCAITGAFGITNPHEAHPTFSGTITRYFAA